MPEDLSVGCAEGTEEGVIAVWPYGLGDIKFIEGTEVTEGHRALAEGATKCECFTHMKAAVSELSPGFRRYGGTLAKIAAQFQEARSTIKEEMTRIAHRNLRCVVTGNLSGRRVMSARLATIEKEARDKPLEGPSMILEVSMLKPIEPESVDTPDDLET